MQHPASTGINPKIYGYLLVFLLIGIVYVYIPIHEFITLINAIHSHAEKIEFVKKAYYLFGGGLLFTIGPIWVVALLLFGKKTDKAQMKKAEFKKYERRVQRNTYYFFAICLGITFILPHLVFFGVDEYLENHGYSYCSKLSKRMTFTLFMVYTKDKCN